MEKRSRRKKHSGLPVVRESIQFFKNYRQWSNKTFVVVLLIVVAISMALTLLAQGIKGVPLWNRNAPAVSQNSDSKGKNSVTEEETSVRIMANGDLLYHIPIYRTALKEDGTYDFHENFEYVKPWLKQADLVIGDFEGTVNKDHYLAGYPLFNAPGEVMDAIKDAGYQVLDLAHNHILDSQIEGVFSTADAIEKAGMTPIGVYTHEPRDKAPIVIKEVKGIKVALLAYSYGFNGIEEYISKEDYENHLSDLNEEKMKSEIERAEKEADITIIMPQMGVEYQLTPTDAQVETYHKMIEWGADVIFGGHPHVAEPTETIEKDGQKKFIIYSMGNLLSNQRIETLDKIWTERGVIMDITIQKEGNQTSLTSVQAHPTWVSRTPINRTFQGYPAYDYQVFLAEDYLPGAKYANTVDETTRQRIEKAYHEMLELLNIQF